jgi:enoyl-CoA hydratase/carnithine racemase
MSHIESAVKGNIFEITINRPDKKNALTLQMYQQLAQSLKEANVNDDIHVVTITGGESCFSSGNDLADFVSAGLLDDSHPVVQFLKTIAAFKKPIIAGVSGYAVGIGTTLLMHCDLVYALDSAVFQLPFVPLGLCPEAASSLILPNLMGYHKAAELLMFGEKFSAQKALENGMINAIIKDQLIADYIQGRAERLAALPQESVIETKRLLKGNHEQVMAVMGKEIVSFGRLLQGAVCQGIIKSFIGR